MTDRERRRLSEISDNRGTPKGIALRVEIVLGAARGIANRVLARTLETSVSTVLLWRKRYEEEGLAGILEDHPRSGRPKQISEERESAIVEATIRTTP
ncbi:MAG TPA: helix-turn-helix domain-containing protein, partial [Bryobacteraceae bacterium]|nr:helix-turn-helix domain-containing protein [Bryobacteraceae bacterium]